MAQKTNKLDQSLIEFVTKLQQKNDIDVAIPQADIDKVLDNPEQYGFDFIENVFTQYVKVFSEAYKLGDKFGKKVIKDA